MTDYCTAGISLGYDSDFGCTLPAGHDGRHEDHQPEHPQYPIVSWDQESATVQGSVIQ